MKKRAEDEHWMRDALELAKCGEGRTAPNPCVGAVLVEAGEKLGEGYHAKAGGPHAEVQAIRQAKRRGYEARFSRATLYVTLEPCSTEGKTPACTGLLLENSLKRVVVGTKDPNPLHKGRGLRLLRRKGMQVDIGVLEMECQALNRDWNFFITTGRPWVVAKIAMSLDGRIAPPVGDSRWLSSPVSRRLAHELRLRAGAIFVGAETVRQDNPQLTVRLPQNRMKGKEQPWRFIFTRSGKVPKTSALLTDGFASRTRLIHNQPLGRLLQELGKEGIVHVLLEGGGKLLGEAFAAGVVNEIAFFTAPCLLGQGAMALDLPHKHGVKRRISLEQLQLQPVGPDWLWQALVVGEEEKCS